MYDPTARYAASNEHFPAARVAPVLQAWVDAHDAKTLCGFGGRELLSQRSGVPVRSLWRILNHDHTYTVRRGGKPPREVPNAQYVKLDTVDALFCAMECVGLFHRDPSTPGGVDGFADIYFRGIRDEQGVEERLVA